MKDCKYKATVSVIIFITKALKPFNDQLFLVNFACQDCCVETGQTYQSILCELLKLPKNNNIANQSLLLKS